MGSRSRWAAPLGFVVAMTGVVGCGGGEVSMDEFTAQANAICQEHRAAIETAASEVMGGGELPGPEAFGQLVNATIIPELSAQFEELDELQAPAEVADSYEAYVDDGAQMVSQMEEDPSVITNPENFAEINEQADAAGLSDACHIGPG